MSKFEEKYNEIMNESVGIINSEYFRDFASDMVESWFESDKEKEIVNFLISRMEQIHPDDDITEQDLRRVSKYHGAPDYSSNLYDDVITELWDQLPI